MAKSRRTDERSDGPLRRRRDRQGGRASKATPTPISKTNSARRGGGRRRYRGGDGRAAETCRPLARVGDRWRIPHVRPAESVGDQRAPYAVFGADDKDGDAGPPQAANDRSQRPRRGGVHQRRRAQIEYEGFRIRSDPIERYADIRRRAEKQRAAHPIHHDIGVGPGFAFALLAIPGVFPHEADAGLGRFRHSVQEDEGAKRHPDRDPRRKIDEYGQPECREQNDRVAPRRAQERHEFLAFGHVPSDDREHRAQRGERNVTGKRRRGDHDDQQVGGMQHARDVAARARPHVGRGARDCPRDRHAAERDRGDIGRSLRHEFAVRTVAPPGHPVGDDGGEKRLDRAEERQRRGVGNEIDERGEIERRKRRRWKRARQFAEPGADCRNVEAERGREDRSRGDGDEHARPLRPPPPETDDDRQRYRGNRDGPRPRRSDRAPERLQLGEEFARLVGQVEPQHLLQLTYENDDRNAGGETYGHRKGDVFDVRPKAQKACRHKDQAGHRRRNGKTAVAVPVDDRGYENDERPGRAADLKSRAAEGGDQETPDDGGEEPLFGSEMRRDRDRQRQGQRHDRDRQA